jgi:hypothetical protein
MRGRSIVFSLAVVVGVAVAVGWILLWQKAGVALPPASGTAEAKPAPVSESPAPLLPPAIAPPASSRPGASLQPSRTPAQERPAAKAPAHESEKTIGIDGVVIVVDSRGDEHGEESGTLAPKFFEPPRGSSIDAIVQSRNSGRTGEEVSVAAGRFHVEVPLDRSLGVERLVLGGRRASFEGEPIEVKAGEPVTIRARWIESIVLHVVDATSRVELDDVTVVRQPYVATRLHPGSHRPEDLVADHVSSPVPVAAGVKPSGDSTREALFARAAGHAWGHATVDFTTTTETTIELAPAAALVVELRGELPHRATRPPSLKEAAGRLFGGGAKPAADPGGRPSLCLRAPSDAPDFDAAAKEALDHFDEAKAEDFPGGRKPSLEEYRRAIEDSRGQYEATRNVGELELARPAVLGETHLDSLQPGDYVVSVEVGEQTETPLVAGRTPVKLVAGETAHASLVLAPITASEPVPLAGTLFVPDGWNAKAFALTIRPLDLAGTSRWEGVELRVASMVALPGRPGWRRWSAGAVPPATYEFTIDEAVFAHVEKIGPAGNDHVELKLGEPALLIVHVVDEASGAPVPLKLLRYTAAYLDGWTGVFPSADLTRDASRESYTARVPVGAGRIESFDDWDWTLDESEAPLEVRSGEQEVTLRVHRTCGLLLALACGGAKVDWPEDLPLECRLEPVGDEGKWLWTGDEHGLSRLAVSRAGRYRVKVPEIPGYAPVEPFEVDVPAGRFVTRTIELTRK